MSIGQREPEVEGFASLVSAPSDSRARVQPSAGGGHRTAAAAGGEHTQPVTSTQHMHIYPDQIDNKPSHSMCCHLAIGAATQILPIQ